ncbi:MAG TPA: hypothetical protein VD790_11100 [Thermoleophilaceae bacterium]|nr:hypothetical protein [Thermoleophilaceae bacterium]
MIAAAIAVALVGPPAAEAARTPVYRDPPRYEGREQAPKTKETPLPKPVELAPSGLGPHVVVDDAGTAHIVWAEGGDSDGLADRAIYCRLKRGARRCDIRHTLRAGPESSFNTDYIGPRIVRVGNQLVIFSTRYPIVVDKPDGGSSTTIWAWTSNDGGSTWSAPAVVGRRNIGDMVVMGPSDSPTILNFAHDAFCGMCITAFRSGQYSGMSGDLGTRSGDSYYPQIELQGGLPVVSWVNLDGTTHMRRWTGQGSVIDPATWTAPTALPGANESDLAGGPSGLALMSARADVRRFEMRTIGPGGFSRPRQITPAKDSAPIFGTLEQDAGGRLLAAWSDRNDFAKRDGLWLRTAGAMPGGGGGRPVFDDARRLIRGIANGQIDLAGTDDGGGFAVFNHTGGVVNFGEIVAAGFGNQTDNGKKGLGAIPGGGQSGTTCQTVKFGAFGADAASGCFLHGTGDKSHLVVTSGEINLHGLRIIPEGETKIVMDPRALRIDTTGAVRVVVSNAVVGEITLWRGELHRDLSAVRPGTNLFEFPIGQYATNILGFDVGADIGVRLERDGVHIPLALKLPPVFGGFAANAELVATDDRGLIVDSLHMELGPIPLGALVINKVELDYIGEGDVWRGRGSITVPAGGTLDATVEFRMGDFNSATISFTPATPIPIGPFVYLLQMGGGFTVDPVHIEASARIGAGAAIQGTAPVNVNGKFEMDFPKTGPANFKMSGTVDIFFFEIGNGYLQFQTDGYAAFGGQIGPFSLGPLYMEAQADGFVDAGAGQFGASVSGKVELCIDVELARPCAGAGADVALSNAGFAACAKLKVVKEFTGGVRFPWKDFGPEIIANPFAAAYALITHIAIPCNTNGYRVAPPRPASARVSQAGGTVVNVPKNVPSHTILLLGEGGAPDITATGPGGAVVRSGEKPTDIGFTATVRNLPATYLVLTNPRPGDWTIVPNPGSPEITQTLGGSGYKPARVNGSVSGKGRKREIRYRIRNLGSGQRVVFAERGRFGTNIVGTTTKARGELKYTIADARGGRRTVLAMVQKEGLQTDQRRLGSYKAPGPIRPGKVRKLRVTRKGNAVIVRWRPAKRAQRHSITVRGRHGTTLGRLVGRKARKVKFVRVRRDERLRVTAYALSEKMRRGPVARKKVRAARR